MDKKEVSERIKAIVARYGKFFLSNGSDNGDARSAIRRISNIEGLADSIYEYGSYEYIGDGDWCILGSSYTAILDSAVDSIIEDSYWDFEDKYLNKDGNVIDGNFIFEKVEGLCDDCTYILCPSISLKNKRTI